MGHWGNETQRLQVEPPAERAPELERTSEAVSRRSGAGMQGVPASDAVGGSAGAEPPG